jgi:riboflavin synthase
VFTGIIEKTATVHERVDTTEQTTLWLAGVTFAAELTLGESVAVNGCCLTVVEVAPDRVRFDLLAETCRVTNLGAAQIGTVVNLERALRVSDRLSGHYVQGHIDTQAAVRDFSPHGSDYRLAIELPATFATAMIHRGSITVDGISLTVAELHDDFFVCWIIPHTLEVTHLSHLSVGKKVNLEFDVLAKYVQRALGKS